MVSHYLPRAGQIVTHRRLGELEGGAAGELPPRLCLGEEEGGGASSEDGGTAEEALLLGVERVERAGDDILLLN